MHDWAQREIRDLLVFDADTVLVVWRARVACPACGPKLEALDWLEPHARVTNRLAKSVARMCKVMPIKRVAEHYSLHWGTVKDIDKAYLGSMKVAHSANYKVHFQCGRTRVPVKARTGLEPLLIPRKE